MVGRPNQVGCCIHRNHDLGCIIRVKLALLLKLHVFERLNHLIHSVDLILEMLRLSIFPLSLIHKVGSLCLQLYQAITEALVLSPHRLKDLLYVPLGLCLHLILPPDLVELHAHVADLKLLVMSPLLEVLAHSLELKPPGLVLLELQLDPLLALRIVPQVLEHVLVVLSQLVHLLISGAQYYVLLPQRSRQLLYLDLAVLVNPGKRHVLLLNHLESGF